MDYYGVLFSFFLVLAKTFLVVFFLNGHVVRIDDLHLRQFLTKPALNSHNFVSLIIKESANRLGSTQKLTETLKLMIIINTYKYCILNLCFYLKLFLKKIYIKHRQ
jgi:hypothetical protein